MNEKAIIEPLIHDLDPALIHSQPVSGVGLMAYGFDLQVFHSSCFPFFFQLYPFL
jgi:hypothetical protein